MRKGIFDPTEIETERLLIIPMTFELSSKTINNDNYIYEELNIKQVDEWPGKDIKDILPIINNKLSLQSVPDGFDVWLFIDKQYNTIVGDGGFKGTPNNKGEIDLGYNIIESKRRQGYGFEAVSALIKWGLSQKDVKAITANCLKDNTA